MCARQVEPLIARIGVSGKFQQVDKGATGDCPLVKSKSSRFSKLAINKKNDTSTSK